MMDHKVPHLKETPSQTAGPYVHIGCTPNVLGINNVFKQDLGAKMITDEVPGEHITIKGTVFDGTGAAVKDAMVEIWQADANGRFNAPVSPDPHFSGWGRCASDFDTGRFSFQTIKPGRVSYDNDRLQAPHITFWVVARGINIGLHTRMYFADEVKANAEDPILIQIKNRLRISTLLAKRHEGATYHFDIHLQGALETIFFDI